MTASIAEPPATSSCATVRQGYVDDLATRFAADCAVVRHGSATLVELAEAKLRGCPPDRDAYAAVIAGLIDQPGGERIDVVVNACTHFPLVSDALAAASPRPLTFVDGGAGIARRVAFLTEGAAWPTAPTPGVAVFTRLGSTERALTPALAARGLTEVRAL